MNQLILGDNLEIMRKMESETIDLIYLDPPFFSNRNYEVIWGDKGEVRSFEDRWSGGIEHYIDWLKIRVSEMHRLLKPTGSIYLHCDWHANSYIRVYILDKIFGENNLFGEIIWQRVNAHGDARKKLAVLTDTIWYYAKSDKFIYNPIYTKHSEEYKNNFYKYDDGDGKGLYRLNDMSSPNPRPHMMYEWLGFKYPAKGWRYQKDTMQKLHDEGKIHYPKKSDGSYDLTKRPSMKRYLNEQKGTLMGNIWTDITNVQAVSSERIGYPTQKPEKLLERIILASSNEGDIVFDPFVGGGTTIVVADKLNRNWIGIDQSVQAVKVSEMRLNNQQNLFSSPFSVQLHKYDYDKLFHQNPKEFEIWIVERFGGRANIKKGGDKGIDGKMTDGTPIQVKQSESIGSVPIRQFVTDAKSYDRNLFKKNIADGKPIGYFIAFSFSRGSVQEVASLKNEDNVIIKLIRVDEIIEIAKKPRLSINLKDLGNDAKGLREIEFTAVGESDAGIEFYSWNFDYKEEVPPLSRGGQGVCAFKASIMLDKEGRQTYKFKPG
ncbi:MAG: DNA methyltransferase, partial [FCB group bacterium]